MFWDERFDTGHVFLLSFSSLLHYWLTNSQGSSFRSLGIHDDPRSRRHKRNCAVRPPGLREAGSPPPPSSGFIMSVCQGPKWETWPTAVARYFRSSADDRHSESTGRRSCRHVIRRPLEAVYCADAMGKTHFHPSSCLPGRSHLITTLNLVSKGGCGFGPRQHAGQVLPVLSYALINF